MSNWPRVQISELCELIVDCVNKTAPSVECVTPYKMIRTTNIKNGRIDLSVCRFVSKVTFDAWTKRAKVEVDDVLLTREAPMGEVGIVNFCESVFLGQRIVQYRANPQKLDPKYLLYSFLSPDLQYQFRKHDSSGSTVSHIRVPDCLKFEIPLPSLHEQKKITAVLSALDGKIDCNNRIVAELETMVKALYGYWFVQFDFPDINGEPYKSAGGKMVYNPVLKRELPEGWCVDALGSLTSLIRRGLSPTYVELGGMLVLNQKCIRDQRVSFFDARRHAVVLDADNERLLRPFDVLVNSTGVGTLGRVAFVKRLDEEKTTVDSHVTIVRADAKKIHSEYLAWTVLHFQPVIEAAANGSTGQVELNKAFVESLNIIVPDSMLQERFSTFVNPLVKALAAREKEVEQLTRLRDWLLPMLMNGQVAVA